MMLVNENIFFSAIPQKMGVCALFQCAKHAFIFTVKRIFTHREKRISNIPKIQNKLRETLY